MAKIYTCPVLSTIWNAPYYMEGLCIIGNPEKECDDYYYYLGSEEEESEDDEE